jgi:hypothetical protein
MKNRWSKTWRKARPHAWLALPACILLVAGIIAVSIISRGQATGQPAAPTVVVSCDGAQASNFDCWQSRYQAMVAKQSPTAAFADFKKNYDTNPYVKSNCHQLGHVIGRAAALKYDTLVETYKHGDQFCWSGYYHGAIETIAKKIGKDNITAQLTDVCKEFYQTERYSFNHYNCVHGMGHGIMALEDSDLFKSLKLCDGYTDPWEGQSCQGGVFMENVMNEINPGKHSSYLKQDEPLYPCTAVDNKYKEQCYLMQTSHALIVVNQDYNKVFSLCAGVEAPYNATCFQSLGRDVSGQSSSDQQRTIDLCMQGPSDLAKSNCFTGAVKDFISYFHSDKQGLAMCAAIPDTTLSSACSLVGRQYYQTF